MKHNYILFLHIYDIHNDLSNLKVGHLQHLTVISPYCFLFRFIIYMDSLDLDDDVDIPTFMEQDVDRYQEELVTQVEMVHELVCKSGPLVSHNMCLFVGVDVYTMA